MLIDIHNRSLREQNATIISKKTKCRQTLADIKKIESFLTEFSVLSLGRDFVLLKNECFSPKNVYTSCELTVGSIISCCESGCIADANSLLRKYRDDLFFYLYVLVYDSFKKIDSKSRKVSEMERNILRWKNNNLYDFSSGTVMREIAEYPDIKEAVLQYNLKSFFERISNRLNNYVHGNGIDFYNCNVIAYDNNYMQSQMTILFNDLRMITVTFLFLLSLCSPQAIMSTDYEDHSDLSLTPPEGCQYWVAPFIVDFFRDNLDLIDKNCLEYLRIKTEMVF